MRALVVVELQRAGDRVQHRRRHARVAALLEPHVIVDADARQHGQLLAPEPGHAAVAVSDGKTDGLGRDPGAPGA